MVSSAVPSMVFPNERAKHAYMELATDFNRRLEFLQREHGMAIALVTLQPHHIPVLRGLLGDHPMGTLVEIADHRMQERMPHAHRAR